MQKITATPRTSPSLASRERALETLLCCREVDFRRHPAAWGYAWLNSVAGSANSAGSLSPRSLRHNAVSTAVAVRKNIGRSSRLPSRTSERAIVANGAVSHWLRVPRHNGASTWNALNRSRCSGSSSLSSESYQLSTLDFGALSLGIFGREGFLFFGRVRKLDRIPRLADSLLATEGGSTRCVPPSHKSIPAAVNSALENQYLPACVPASHNRPFFSRVRPHVFRSPERIERAAEPGCLWNFGRSFVFEVLA